LIEPAAQEQLEREVVRRLAALETGPLLAQREAAEAARKVGVDPDALSTMRTRQGTIVLEMTRVLEAMSQWDSFVDIVSHLDEVIRIQTNVRKGVRDAIGPEPSAEDLGAESKPNDAKRDK
jgi:hypothetical protein